MEKNAERALDLLARNTPLLPWMVVGSTNLALHGLSVSPNDIDISVRMEDVSRVEHAFWEARSGTKALKKGSANEYLELTLSLGGICVQVIGEQDGLYDRFLDRAERITLDGRVIPCLPLELEARCYEHLGR